MDISMSIVSSNSNKVILKKTSASAFREDVTEFLLTFANGMKTYAQVNSIVISKEEEKLTVPPFII
eukprot:2868068-Ditylum_brightwellii.AAC.1